MPLTTLLVPCLEDNYGFLVRDEESGLVATVDTPDAQPLLDALDELGWKLDLILNTHKQATISAAMRPCRNGPARGDRARRGCRASPRGPRRRSRRPGEAGRDPVGGARRRGHTLGHISLFRRPEIVVAFVGDTVSRWAAAGCSKGRPEQMWASLQRLAGLADDARSIAPTNIPPPTPASRSASTIAPGARADPPVSQRVNAAKPPCRPPLAWSSTNPFLRAPTLRPDLKAAQAFAEIRRAKDDFRG